MERREGAAQGLREYLLREPRGGLWSVIGFVIGVSCLIYFLLGSPSQDDYIARVAMIGVGLMVTLMNAAELVPGNRTTLAGGLRIGGMALSIIIIILFMVDLLT